MNAFLVRAKSPGRIFMHMSLPYRTWKPPLTDEEYHAREAAKAEAKERRKAKKVKEEQ